MFPETNSFLKQRKGLDSSIQVEASKLNVFNAQHEFNLLDSSPKAKRFCQSTSQPKRSINFEFLSDTNLNNQGDDSAEIVEVFAKIQTSEQKTIRTDNLSCSLLATNVFFSEIELKTLKVQIEKVFNFLILNIFKVY